MADEMRLGRALLAVLRGVNRLVVTAELGDVERLAALRERLLDEIGRLVDANLDEADRRYAAATASLAAASTAIEEALDDLALVAEAIAVLGQAVDLAAEVAA